MQPAPLPVNEEERLKELYSYKIIDTDEEKIFNTIVSLAASVCEVPISLVTFVDRDRQWFKAVTGLPPGSKQTNRDVAFCAHTILSDTVFEVEDASKDSRFSDNPLVTSNPHIRFYGGVPITNANGFKLGTICVIDQEPKQLTEQQKKQLQELSEIVMALMEAKKKMLNELKDRQTIADQLEKVNGELGAKLNEQQQSYSNLSLLSQMNGMLESCLSNEEAFSVIKQFCLDLFPQSCGMIYLIEKHHEYLELMSNWGKTDGQEHVLLSEDCWALRRGQYYLAENNQNLKCKHFEAMSVSNKSMCIPLMAQGESLGLLSLIFNPETAAIKDNKILSGTEHLLAIAMGEQIAIALANIKLRQTLKEQSIYDPLTALYNRRYLFETFRREMSKTLRTNTKLILDMIDIDHFKKFNDQFGHDAGDFVLQTVAQKMKAVGGQHDIACRLGGEEFVLIFQNTCAKDAFAKAELLRKSIEGLKLEYKGKDLGKITISQGLASFPDDAKSLEELLKKADVSLYAAKESGRNCIIVTKSSSRST